MKLHNSLLDCPLYLNSNKARVNINMKISHCSRTSEGVGIRFIWDEGVSMLYWIINLYCASRITSLQSICRKHCSWMKVSVCMWQTAECICFPIAELGSTAILKNKKSPHFVRIWKRCRITFVVKIFIVLNWHFLNYRVFGKKNNHPQTQEKFTHGFRTY